MSQFLRKLIKTCTYFLVIVCFSLKFIQFLASYPPGTKPSVVQYFYIFKKKPTISLEQNPIFSHTNSTIEEDLPS